MHYALEFFAILSIYVMWHIAQYFLIFKTIIDLFSSLGLYEALCDLNVKILGLNIKSWSAIVGKAMSNTWVTWSSSNSYTYTHVL
jgi:hypothetical protein